MRPTVDGRARPDTEAPASDGRPAAVAGAKEWLFQNLYIRFVDSVSCAVMAIPVPWLRHAYLALVLHWELGEGVSIERGVRIIGGGRAVLGPATHVNGGATLDTRGGLALGAGVDVARGAQLLTSDHDPDAADFSQRYRSVRVGDRVWVATNAVVLPGTTIESGVVLAAGAVASGVLGADGVYAGVPARRVRDRAERAQADKPRTRPRW